LSEVTIIGAGPAGLTAAYELAGKVDTLRIIEAEQQVGGLCRTISHQGYRFDIGGHRFFSSVPYIQKLWQTWLSGQLLTVERMSHIYYQGQFFDYPLKFDNVLKNMGLYESLRLASSYLKSQFVLRRDDENLENWLINRFGVRLYRTFFQHYTEKIWDRPCNELASQWADQRIKGLSFISALRSALPGLVGRRQVPKSLIERFFYPVLGPGMMWEACAEIATARGALLVQGTRIDHIHCDHGRVVAIAGRHANGDECEYSGDYFISSMPLAELATALRPAPERICAAAQKLNYRDFITIILVLDRPSLFPDQWIYIQAPNIRMCRIQNFKNWSPAMVPDDSQTVLGLEYIVSRQDDLWNWPSDRLIDFGIKECVGIGLIRAGEVLEGYIQRIEKAYPVYDRGYEKHLSPIMSFVATLGNLATIGRNGLHRYNNMDHSMVTGILAAKKIIGERVDSTLFDLV